MKANMAQIVQIQNMSALATKTQLTTLLGFIGEIETLALFASPSEPSVVPRLDNPRTCYVTYKNVEDASVALHLHATLFLDKLLIVALVDAIPDGLTRVEAHPGGEQLIKTLQTVLQAQRPPSTMVMQQPGIIAPGVRAPILGGIQPSIVPAGVPMQNSFSKVVQVEKRPVVPDIPVPSQIISGDPMRADEVRRTVYVGNLGPTVNSDALLAFFKQAGEITYVKMSDAASLGLARFAFVEFAEAAAATRALTFTGQILGDRPVKVNLSKNALVKGPKPSVDEAEAAKKKALKAAMSFITESATSESKEADASEGDDHRSRDRDRDRRSRRGGSRDRSRRRDRDRRRHRDDDDDRDRSRSRRSRRREEEDDDDNDDDDRGRDRDRSRRSRSRRHRSRSRSKSP
eukprot:m.123012 g.123012  ORF g.123012 m.123012 type:complete len:402 (+) comp14442_c0_seq1:90-1295(+)